jgi:endonuclease/exonuclease/phosphatase family metal-dependent hydrolase
MSLRLATWNVQWCCGLDGAVDVERIAAQLRSLGDLDVCCLQELAVNYPALRSSTSVPRSTSSMPTAGASASATPSPPAYRWRSFARMPCPGRQTTV